MSDREGFARAFVRPKDATEALHVALVWCDWEEERPSGFAVSMRAILNHIGDKPVFEINHLPLDNYISVGDSGVFVYLEGMNRRLLTYTKLVGNPGYSVWLQPSSFV